MISQISKGVYVVSPEAQKRYQDTAAGEYTSVFTKARANMWEMSKQQAAMNIKEDSDRYRTEMALYGARIADMDKRAAALEAAKADYLAGRITADATLQKSAMAEATDRQKNEINFKKAGAEQFGLSSGGASTSTGGTGGGAAGGGGVKTGSVQDFETLMRGKPLTEKLVAVGEIGKPGGIVADLDPKETEKTINEVLDREHARLAADLELSGVSTDEADVQAAVQIIDELAKTDPARARAYEARGTSPPAATAAGSSSARVDRGQRSASRFRNLGEMPAVVDIKAELLPSEAAEFDRSIAKIGEERALLGLPPVMPASDYITLARRIAAGRIAGQVGGRAAPFEQQLRLDKLLNASPEDRAALRAAFVASRAAPAAPAALAPRASAEELLRGTLSETDREDVRRTGYATSLAASPLAPPFNDLEKARLEDEEQKRRMILDEVEFGSAADQIIVEPAVAPAPSVRIPAKPRARAASPETQAFLEENGAPFEFSSAADQIVVEPPPVMLGPPQAPAGAAGPVRANMGARSALPPGMTEAAAVMRETYTPKVAEGSGRANMGARSALPPGMTEAAAVMRETYTPKVAEGSGRANMGATSARPPGMTEADAVMRETYTPQVAAGSGRANIGGPSALPPTKVDVEAAKTVMREPPPPPPPPTASKYFQNRYEAAADLAQKPDKLARLVASGNGKVVAAIYNTNVKTNIPFERGYQEIALQFAGDEAKMAQAHEILFALDIQAKAATQPKE